MKSLYFTDTYMFLVENLEDTEKFRKENKNYP